MHIHLRLSTVHEHDLSKKEQTSYLIGLKSKLDMWER